jgi:hypothetical protein
MARKPAHDDFDAELILTPVRGETTQAHALFKLTFAISPGKCDLAPAEPLLHDWRDPELERPMIGGSDFWLAKPFTDLVIQGSACAPQGKPSPRLSVRVCLGATRKDVTVWGPRPIAWEAGRPRIGAPEPFVSMPMTWVNAYGGIDWRVPVPGADQTSFTEIPALAMRVQFEHPGMYPRNPFGMGYLVQDGEVPDMPAPRLEDPLDPLTDDRLITRDPAAWWRQPLPWCLDWTNPIMFPRACWFGPDVDPWFPAPDDRALAEVKRGFVGTDFRRSRCPGGTVDARFFQGASHGLVITRPEAGQVLSVSGMHPEYDLLAFALPATDRKIIFEIEGKRTVQPARLHHIVCRPEELRLNLVFAAEVPLPRPFLPGIHKHIPVHASLDGEMPIEYQTPDPVRERVAAIRAAEEGKP